MTYRRRQEATPRPWRGTSSPLHRRSPQLPPKMYSAGQGGRLDLSTDTHPLHASASPLARPPEFGPTLVRDRPPEGGGVGTDESQALVGVFFPRCCCWRCQSATLRRYALSAASAERRSSWRRCSRLSPLPVPPPWRAGAPAVSSTLRSFLAVTIGIA